VFAFPAPPVPDSPMTTRSGIQRRRGAIVELPGEWYAKAGEHNALGLARTRSGDSVEADRIRRVQSYDVAPLFRPAPAPAETPRSAGPSVLGGVRRGKSAQAALGASPAPAPTSTSAPAPAPTEEQEKEQDAFDWRESFGFSDDASISFEFEDGLDAIFD
jgi:hypothetical protein